MTTPAYTPLISIIIVNYKVPEEICQLLRSLKQADCYTNIEIIVVDNASQDFSEKMVLETFPGVIWISLKNNIGFGKACNVGSQRASGKYLLFINPDTIVSQNTLRVSVDFMESRPDVGIMGPKIIKPDGSFQPHCRRSFPTPFNAFVYVTGLSRLFPKNSRLCRYNLTNISPDISMEVDAVSGSYIFIRHTLFKQLEGFDKAFFMYGEDLDLCARCKQLGNKVWYHPATQIIHFKGKSCTKNVLRSRLAFFEAMIIFSKKYRHSYGAFFPGWLLVFSIFILGGINILGILVKSFAACFIDLIVINTTLWATTYFRFQTLQVQNPYTGENVTLWVGMHIIMSLSFLATYVYQGIYTSDRYSTRHVFISGLFASILFFSGVFFIKKMAFSRIAFALSAFLIPLLLIGWRQLLPKIVSGLKTLIYSTGNVLVMGNSHIASALIRETERDITANICGVIWPDNQMIPGDFEGYPVLGCIDDLKEILQRQHANILLIATTASWYSAVIEALAYLHLKHLSIRWVPLELFQSLPEKIPATIPLNDFSV